MRKLKQLLNAIFHLDKIILGIYRTIFKSNKQKLQEDFNKKMAICNMCEYIDRDGKLCLIYGTEPCCGVCGCSLTLKIASGDKCPEGKW